MNAALAPRLGQEEDAILPVASATMSQQEWDAFGQHAMKTAPKNRILIELGYALDAFTPDERTAWMKSSIPGPLRAIYRWIGRRQYETDHRRVYGTAPS